MPQIGSTLFKSNLYFNYFNTGVLTFFFDIEQSKFIVNDFENSYYFSIHFYYFYFSFSNSFYIYEL